MTIEELAGPGQNPPGPYWEEREAVFPEQSALSLDPLPWETGQTLEGRRGGVNSFVRPASADCRG